MVRGEQDRESIRLYIEEKIIPQYNEFDKGHDIQHVRRVINDSLDIASNYTVNMEMVYVIAAYHDIGLIGGREGHEKKSGEMLLADNKLKEWFDEDELKTMCEAVEDHRASNSSEPRSIYGKIVSEADRDISYHIILKRTIQYSLNQFSNYTYNQHLERSYDHILGKYGEDGYIKLWLNTEKNVKGLSEIREALKNKDKFTYDFKTLYKSLIDQGN